MTELNHTQKVKRIYKNRTGQSDKWMLQFCFCGSLSIVGVKKKVENKRHTDEICRKRGCNFCNTCFVVIKNEMKSH